jgi:hypothetical protein
VRNFFKPAAAFLFPNYPSTKDIWPPSLHGGQTGDERVEIYFPISSDFFEVPFFLRNFCEGCRHSKEVRSRKDIDRYFSDVLEAVTGDLIFESGQD